MPKSLDLKVFNHRNREIRRLVRRGSPALVYSGPLGIVIAASMRAGTDWRIGKVMDRMAIIGRGDAIARGLIHKIASAEARGIAGKLSQGDVKGPEPAHAVGAVLQERNGRYTLGASLAVEACFVQLNATPAGDYLSYIPFEGIVQTFRKAWFLGEASGREATTSLQRQAAADEVNDRLTESLGDYERFGDFWEALVHLNLPEPVRALRESSKLDIVLLDRRALERHEYENVFVRPAL